MSTRKILITLATVIILAVLFSPLILAGATSGTTFEPPNGKKVLFIGQDVDSINAYVVDVGITPGGFVGYTSINEQEGIHSDGDNGAGRNNLDELAASYPESNVEVAVWIVNQCQNIIDNTPWGAVRDYNERMDTLIASLVAYDRPVFLRWGYEFDGLWNDFEPECYKGAWIRMWDRIQLNNAQDHIAMVWQGASYCDGTYGGYPISAWYPGDQYVDWVGLSYFTPQDCNWSAVNEIVQFARDHNKPVMIAESTPQRYDIGELTYSPNTDGSGKVNKTAQEIWDEWFVPYLNFIETNSDVIKAVSYINADWDSQRMWKCPPCRSGYWGDSRVQANPLIEANWINTITGADWMNASPTLFSDLGYTGGGANPTSTSLPTDTPVPTATSSGPTPTFTNTPVPTDTPITSTVMHSEDIFTTDQAGTPLDVFNGGDYIYWQVQIRDQSGNPVEGATVDCEIYTPTSSTWSYDAVTDVNGWAYFSLHSTPGMAGGIYTISVVDVTKSGATYNSGANVKDTHNFILQ